MSFSGIILFNHARALPWPFTDSLADATVVTARAPLFDISAEAAPDEVVETVAATKAGSRGRLAPTDKACTGARALLLVVVNVVG